MDKELLLGKETPLVDAYSPDLLFPIERADARSALGINESLPFYGEDIWHAYELSWLQTDGVPLARVGRFTIPADSPMLVESKSFKLYLNSLNFAHFASEADAIATITRDVSRVAGAPVDLALFPLDDARLNGASLAGECVDAARLTAAPPPEPEAHTLQITGSGKGRYHSHLLRSLCPVTSQPDWASVSIAVDGVELGTESLLRYLLAYRQHQEFHEQCVERIFRDITEVAAPNRLEVQAFYTRRGGMDINPWRCSEPGEAPLMRLNRQ